MHLLLRETYHLFEVENRLCAHPPDKVFGEIGVGAEYLFKDIDIDKTGGGIFNSGGRIIVAVIHINPGAEDVVNGFDKAKDQVFANPLDIDLDESAGYADKVRRGGSLLEYDLTGFVLHLVTAVIDACRLLLCQVVEQWRFAFTSDTVFDPDVICRAHQYKIRSWPFYKYM
jgi:hypothetical protein